MISASRASVCSKLHESRDAFCCISSAEVATPPAFAALPGPNSTPASLSTRIAPGVVGMFAPSASAMSPPATSFAACASLISFCVAQGRATWIGVSLSMSQTDAPGRNVARPPARRRTR